MSQITYKLETYQYKIRLWFTSVLYCCNLDGITIRVQLHLNVIICCGSWSANITTDRILTWDVPIYKIRLFIRTCRSQMAATTERLLEFLYYNNLWIGDLSDSFLSNRSEWVSLRLQEQQINRHRWWLVRSTRCEGNDWNKTTGSWWCFLSQTARWRSTSLLNVCIRRRNQLMTNHLVANGSRKTEPTQLGPCCCQRFVLYKAKLCHMSLSPYSEGSKHR